MAIPLNYLPPMPSAAIDKLLAADTELSEVLALLKVNQDERLQVQENADRAIRDRRVQTSDTRRRELPSIEEEISAIERRRDTELARLEDRANFLKLRLSQLGWVEAAVERLSEDRRREARFKECRREPVKLKPGQTKTDAVALLRSDIIRVSNEAEATANAPCKAEELKPRLEREVLAAGRAPTLRLRNRSGEASDFVSRLMIGASGSSGRLIGDAGASLLVWLFRDEIIEKLHKLVDEADLTGALFNDEREKKLAELSERKLLLERQEEALIMAAAADAVRAAVPPAAAPASGTAGPPSWPRAREPWLRKCRSGSSNSRGGRRRSPPPTQAHRAAPSQFPPDAAPSRRDRRAAAAGMLLPRAAWRLPEEICDLPWDLPRLVDYNKQQQIVCNLHPEQPQNT